MEGSEHQVLGVTKFMDDPLQNTGEKRMHVLSGHKNTHSHAKIFIASHNSYDTYLKYKYTRSFNWSALLTSKKHRLRSKSLYS